ncbi:DUF5005 domain-containing protein [Actinomadura sp. WMMB 499]|uniref:DUF5005 domain-containing protein n=1 Tax=Actinomadura sp. WMMB 499 TaxID=1219491 RepID=UPI001245E4EB|nr:DUF5005 domain-containing protein [Actinomadura sp. WMMB 499]QFG25105.1 DUF5005 domain-containing protein [Actinomadura sp. WMMB 499]
MSRSALALALTAGLVVVPAAPAAAQAAPVCAGRPAPTFGTATQNTAQNAKFTTYGNSNARLDDWTGADTTYSLRLSDGRIVYAYSDTFLGKVNADGSRPPVIEEGGTTPFLNNSFVVQGTNGSLRTVHGGTAANPTAPMPPSQAAHWYWAGDLTQHASEVQQLYREYYDPDPGNGDPWDLKWKRNVLARFSTGNLSGPMTVNAMPSATGVQWGSALLEDGGHTYIYGTEDYTDPDTKQNTKYLHIARVDGDDLRGDWSYRTAGGWSSEEADSARLMSGVSNEFSVTKRGAHYIMVNQDTEFAFGAEIDVLLSCSAGGPFTAEQAVYTTPETGSWPDVYTYNAHQHASLSSSGNLVISYNVNTLDNAEDDGVNDNYRYVSIYRARYIDLPVTG